MRKIVQTVSIVRYDANVSHSDCIAMVRLLHKSKPLIIHFRISPNRPLIRQERLSMSDLSNHAGMPPVDFCRQIATQSHTP